MVERRFVRLRWGRGHHLHAGRRRRRDDTGRKQRTLPKECRKLVNVHLADAQTLANSLGNGVTPAEVLAVAATRHTMGTNTFAKTETSLAYTVPALVEPTTRRQSDAGREVPSGNHGFLLSGQHFVGNVGPYTNRGWHTPAGIPPSEQAWECNWELLVIQPIWSIRVRTTAVTLLSALAPEGNEMRRVIVPAFWSLSTKQQSWRGDLPSAK